VKFLTTLIAGLSAPDNEASVRALVRLSGLIVGAVALFSVGFHAIMAFEGRDYSWWTSVYWTLVTMSTLGYGDITFLSDLGRMYSLVVLFAGAILILVMMPFTFIQVVYLPWRSAMRRAGAPRELPASIRDHVIVVGLDPVSDALIDRLRAAGVDYALLVDDVEEGLALHDDGYRVAVGAYDDPETYRGVRADRAAMIFTGRNDTTNTNVAFTAREVTDRPTIVATVDHVDSIDILELAGCDRVLHLGDLLGRAFARRILSPTARSKTIAGFEDLVIAETSAAGTELVGRTLMELGLRRRFGVTVVGLWERGSLEMATPELTVEETSILILAGTRDQIAAYDAAYTTDADGDGIPDEATAPVVIIGGGRVGRATAAALAESGIDYRIIERLGERIRDDDRYVHGDAADRDTLRRAGIDDTPAVVVTTHDDDTNLFLTLYCRKLRPEIEILGRVTRDRNLSTIHRAGADFVLSYASAGAIEVWNTIRADSTVLLAEGLVMFRTPTPRELTTRPLRETHVPRATGCYVIAVVDDDDGVSTQLDLDAPLPADSQIVLIGTEEGEQRFLRRYVARSERSRLGRWWDRLRGRT
jgi:voltage-gated potassium channel